jgi:hypothetical protein
MMRADMKTMPLPMSGDDFVAGAKQRRSWRRFLVED